MRRTLGIVLAVVAIAVGAWFLFARADPGAPVHARLDALADMVNKSTVDGLGPEARSAQLGTFFTEDVDVELGSGAAPIRGRATIIGMAARLQPRTAAFEIRFQDVSVTMGDGGQTASVHLTAEFVPRDRGIIHGSTSATAKRRASTRNSVTSGGSATADPSV